MHFFADCCAILIAQCFVQNAMLPLSLTQLIHLQRAANGTEITLKFLYSKKSLAIEARPVGGDRKSRMDVTWADLSAMRLLLTVSLIYCLVAHRCYKGLSFSISFSFVHINTPWLTYILFAF